MRLMLATCRNLPAWEIDDRFLHAALHRRGVPFELVPWDDAGDLARFAACLLRTTWDYQERRDGFVAFCARAAAATRLWNPLPVVRWNTHKHYLRDLQRSGVLLAPTVWLDRGAPADVAAHVRAAGWRRGFLKPCIGATARETLPFIADAAGLRAAQAHVDRLQPHEDLILQEFQESVGERGEWSAIFVDGRLSHCVRKVPVPGDYRVQDDFGAHDEPYSPTAAERAVAQAVVELVLRAGGPCPGADGTPLLYARTDFLWDAAGRPVLTELELVEPSLFFRHGPDTAERLADALLARLGAVT